MNRFFIIVFLFSSAMLWSQNSSQCSANVTASLVQGLSTQLINPNLDFGETILDGNASVLNKDPQKGINLKISGHPRKDVIFNYSPVQLTSSSGSLNFTPDVRHTNADPVYSDPVTVADGCGVPLKNLNGDGVLYLWVGGNINIQKNQPAGDYSGSFLITVSY